jgi:RNA polymerase sigma-70 factor (ECF subfamily)
MAPDDRDLIIRAQQGEVAAFEQLVFRYDKQVLTLAARYTMSPDDAKDIYQEVFIRVFRALKSFRFKSEFSTWLHRITANVCLTHTARKKKNTFTLIGDESDERGPMHQVQSLEPSSHQQAVEADIVRQVHEALESLPARQKLVFTLRHYEGYKLKEIAGMMECTEGTVKRYLFLATQEMRKRLKTVHQS